MRSARDWTQERSNACQLIVLAVGIVSDKQEMVKKKAVEREIEISDDAAMALEFRGLVPIQTLERFVETMGVSRSWVDALCRAGVLPRRHLWGRTVVLAGDIIKLYRRIEAGELDKKPKR